MKKNKTDSKKEKKVREEKSEIEEEIKNVEKEINLKELSEKDDRIGNIKEFLIQGEIKAPVLERIVNREPPIENQFETQQREITEERKINYSISNEPKYSTGTRTEEERKYETTFIPPVLTQREIFEGEFFTPMRSAWEKAKQISETPQEFRTLETERRKLPFEEEQKKYRKIKF